MVFSINYDKALWLIVQGDKFNRKFLMRFVNSLTDEMYDFIHNFIYGASDDLKITCLPGDNFTLFVGMKENALTIKLNQYNISKERFIFVIISFYREYR